MLETCRLKSREPTWFHEPHQGLRLLPSTIVAAAGLAEKSWLLCRSHAVPFETPVMIAEPVLVR